MSDPLANAERDVLTSLRRLVSMDTSADRREDPAREALGRLILTPDLRIEDVVAAEMRAQLGLADREGGDDRAFSDDLGAESASDPAAASGVDPALSAGLDSDGPIDAEMLRDMVAEIVRQELQGALGERITRNVRKLVRQEVHRVLAAQDQDQG